MCKELDERGVADVNKLGEQNVIVENLTMNVAMHNRTISNLVEDHKEIIDRHTKEIEELKNKPAFEMPEMPAVKGDGLDMA